MNSGRWQEVKALLGEVLDLAPERRERFLAEYVADADLKREVARLLEGGPDLKEFLEPPPKAEIEEPLRMISLAFTGCSIGDYKLVEDIGRGASGTVYRAKHVSLGRPAAVKILAHHLCVSERARERFRREAEAASKLRHDAIVSIFAYGEQCGACYIAMELVTGDNLRDLIADRAAHKAGVADGEAREGMDVSDPRVAAALVEKLARGLQHCHENRVIHRDVKPENIVIDENLQPRLIDFGLAKDGALEGLTETGTLSGTPHYMSPEQARAFGSAVDRRTDIYSLGVVLYELLTLQRPFETTEPGDLLRAIGHNEPRHVSVVNPKVPADLAAVCMQALARAPEDRYATAAAMADDLQRFLAGEPTHAPHYSPLRKVRVIATRHRLKTAVWLLIVCISAISAMRFGRNTVDAGHSIPASWPGSGGAGDSTPAGGSQSDIRTLREKFEQSIEGMPEKVQLEQRMYFNQILKSRIRAKGG